MSEYDIQKDIFIDKMKRGSAIIPGREVGNESSAAFLPRDRYRILGIRLGGCCWPGLQCLQWISSAWGWNSPLSLWRWDRYITSLW